jgi:hypothetical protein
MVHLDLREECEYCALRFGVSEMRANATACRRFRYGRNVAGMCRINGGTTTNNKTWSY